jgi:hypothetical protein
MIWLNPAALFALAAAAAPILIHILIQRRAERFPFPTLRFLRPTRLAAIRRHVLEDLPLLAVRVALLCAAVVALAGPLFVTAARRQGWDRRVARAMVEDAVPARDPERVAPQLFRQQTFQGESLADGIRRAVLWLDTAPPARREIVVASAFPIGALSEADVAAIPRDIGIRFERTGTLPNTRTTTGGLLLTASGARAREVTFDRDRTLVREAPASTPAPWPIEVIAPPEQQAAADAAIAAVLSQHVWAAPPDRRARLILAAGEVSPERDQREGGPAAIGQPWIADAVARIARDGDLRAAAAQVTAGLADARFTSAPWQVLAAAADGRPLAAAAESKAQLVVSSAASGSEIVTPVLLRSIANAMAPALDVRGAEVVAIADGTLQRWSRPALPVSSPRVSAIDNDDRRWIWLAVLALLALETWIRRSRRDDISSREEDARVA